MTKPIHPIVILKGARGNRVLGFALVLFSVSVSWAEIGDKGTDEATLRADAQKVFKEKVAPFVNKYCTRCHGSRAKAGINLQSALKNPGGESASLHWKKAVANVKVHEMPPDDASKIPTDEERRQFIEWMGNIKYLAPRDPGPFVIRRLTKTEYANTLHDLYGVDPAIADSLPEEVVGEGFLNSISPLQSELFLGIANKVVEQVVAPKTKRPLQSRSASLARCRTLRRHADLRKVRPESGRRAFSRWPGMAYRRPPTDAELDVLVDSIRSGSRTTNSIIRQHYGLMLKACPRFTAVPLHHACQK